MGYLTKDNLDQIRIYLGKTGVKDSQFEEQNTLTGQEYMTLVSDTGNKKIRTSALKTIFTGEGTSTTGGIQTVNTKTDLDNLNSKGYGNLVYVKDEDQYYSYSSTESWELVTKIYIGTQEPTDKTVLWFNNGTPILSNGLNNTSINTVYKWDQTSQKWIIVCSNSALGIKTTNSKLLNQGEQVISIDVALERIKDLVTTVTEMATATKNTVDNNWTKQW